MRWLLCQDFFLRTPCQFRRKLHHQQLFLWLFLLLILVQSSQGRASSSYYDLLGVPRTASEKDIQKAYRKLALKCHPDKGGDEEEFKTLSRAYDCLSDANKRQVYDNFGEAGLEGGIGSTSGFPGSNSGAGNPFQSFFSSPEGKTGGFGTEAFSFGMPSSPNGNGNIDISQILRDMMMGGSSSGGSFSFFAPGSTHTTTPGKPSRQSSSSPSQQRQKKPHTSPPRKFTKPLLCTLEDLATGRTKKMKVNFQGHEKVFEIALKPGWKEGTKITFSPTNDPDFPSITMVFEIQEAPHAYLRRQGNDLHYTCWISESQSNKGGGIQLQVPLPTGEVWSKQIPKDNKNILHGKQMIIPSKGMPIKGGPERGDLVIQFRVRRSSSSSG